MPALPRCLLGVNKASVILSAQHPLGVFFVFCFAFLSWLTSLSCQNHVLEIVGELGVKTPGLWVLFIKEDHTCWKGPGKACFPSQNLGQVEIGKMALRTAAQAEKRLPSTQKETDHQVS